MTPTQGVSFGGRYELQSLIAIGGMGEPVHLYYSFALASGL